MTWAGESSGSGLMRFTEDGSPAEVAGSEGTILRWSDGVPSFDDPASISGIFAPPNGVAVGPNEVYTTLEAAIEAGETNIHVVGNTTEVGQIDLPASDIIVTFHGGVQVDFGSNDVNWIFGSTLRLVGNGEIRWAGNASTYLFGASGTDKILIIDGVDIRNESSNNSARLHRGILHVSNCRVILPNQNDCFWAGSNSAGNYLFMSNVEIVGGGSSCYNIMSGIQRALFNVSDIVFTGEFNSSGQDVIDLASNNANGGAFSNIVVNTDNDGCTFHFSNVVASNFSTANELLVDVNIGEDAVISNFSRIDTLTSAASIRSDSHVSNVKAGAISLNSNNAGNRFSNCVLGSGQTTLLISAAVDQTFANCVFDYGTLTFFQNMNDLYFVNCEFLGNVNMQADTSKFENCRFNGNLTIDSAASGVVVLNSTVDGTLTNNGTDCQIFNLPVENLNPTDVLAFDGSSWVPSGIAPSAGGAASGVTVQDEGTIIDDFAQLNFVGGGVTAADGGGGVATITIPGSTPSGVTVQDEGTIVDDFEQLNFVGAGVTASDGGGGVATITIPGSTPSGVTVQDEGTIVGDFDQLNFVGPGISASDAGGGVATITTLGPSGVRVQDEGVIVDDFDQINFVGAGVTATDGGGGIATVTIPGSTPSGVTVQDEGIIVDDFEQLNFVGAGVTATDGGGGVATITIPGGGGSTSGITVQDEGVIQGDFSQINFVGEGVVATDGGGGVATITIADDDQIVPVGVTVASGIPADFTTVAEAVASGNTYINIIGYTEENTDTDVPTGKLTLVFHGNSLLTMNTNDFSFLTSGRNMEVRGDGRIHYAYTDNFQALFAATATQANTVVIDGVDISNKSTAIANYIHNGNLTIRNSIIELNNTSNGFTNPNSRAYDILISDCELVGGGSSSAFTVENAAQANIQFNNLKITGEFANTIFNTLAENAIVSNLLFDTIESSMSFRMTNGVLSNIVASGQGLGVGTENGTLANLSVDNGALNVIGDDAAITNVTARDFTITVGAKNNMISNCKLGDGSTTLIISDTIGHKISNCTFDYSLITIQSSVSGIMFSNCTFKNGTVRVRGNTNKFIGCDFQDGFDFESPSYSNVIALSMISGALTDVGVDNQVFNLPVDTLNPTDVLAYDGLEWVPSGIAPGGGGGGPTNLDDLDDVSVGSAASGHLLFYDGTDWIPSPVKHYGAHPWNPPVSPNAGDKYYNTTLNHEMAYDGTRSKWLSVATFFEGAGRNGSTSAGGYYRRFNGMVESAVLGGAVPSGTVVYIGQTRSDTDSATLEVMLDGSQIATQVSTAQITQDSSVNVDFGPGNMAFRNQAGGNTTSSLQATVHYKLRAAD